MNGQWLTLWASLLALLLLQCTAAQELEAEQDHQDVVTATMELATTNLMATATAVHHDQTEPIYSITELQEPKSSAMPMETKPSGEALTESIAAQDYQDDAAAPQVDANAPQVDAPAEAMETTAAATPTPTADKESDAKPDINSSITPIHGCFSCESFANGTCVRHPTERKQCPTKSKSSGCYTLFKRETARIMRGCVSDLTEEGVSYCNKEPKLCSFCKEKHCNKQDAPTSGTAQLLGSLALCLIALLYSV